MRNAGNFYVQELCVNPMASIAAKLLTKLSTPSSIGGEY